MKNKFKRPKLISDPIYGLINISNVIKFIDNERFQSLGFKYQLGLTSMIFPSATHTRKAHSLGTYQATKNLTYRWKDSGFINEEEKKALEIYALYHDWGHFALSHATEALCRENHDEFAVELLERFKDIFVESEVNFDVLKRIFEHKDNLYLAVHDKTLGMDKLDYLCRDGLFTIRCKPNGADYVREHLYYLENKLVIDEKAVDEAKDIQEFYIKMYKNVYLRKAAVILQRMMHKILYHMIKGDEISQDEIKNMNDFELLGRVSNSKIKKVKYMYKNLMTRNLYKEGLVVRKEKYNHNSNKFKDTNSIGLKSSDFNELIEMDQFNPKNINGLSKLEKMISDKLSIPYEDILIVPVLGSWRFNSMDVNILSKGNEIDSMKRRYPKHFKNLEEIADSYKALRLCSYDKYKDLISSDKCKNIVLDLIFTK